MPNIGAPELAIVLGVFILIFGAKKLPELGTAVGQTIRNLKSSTQDETDPKEQATDDKVIAA